MLNCLDNLKKCKPDFDVEHFYDVIMLIDKPHFYLLRLYMRMIHISHMKELQDNTLENALQLFVIYIEKLRLS